MVSLKFDEFFGAEFNKVRPFKTSKIYVLKLAVFINGTFKDQ